MSDARQTRYDRRRRSCRTNSEFDSIRGEYRFFECRKTGSQTESKNRFIRFFPYRYTTLATILSALIATIRRPSHTGHYPVTPHGHNQTTLSNRPLSGHPSWPQSDDPLTPATILSPLSHNQTILSHRPLSCHPSATIRRSSHTGHYPVTPQPQSDDPPTLATILSPLIATIRRPFHTGHYPVTPQPQSDYPLTPPLSCHPSATIRRPSHTGHYPVTPHSHNQTTLPHWPLSCHPSATIRLSSHTATILSPLSHNQTTLPHWPLTCIGFVLFVCMINNYKNYCESACTYISIVRCIVTIIIVNQIYNFISLATILTPLIVTMSWSYYSLTYHPSAS